VQVPTIRSLSSPDLPSHDLPADPHDCAILVEAEIGALGGSGADVFAFQVVTPQYLMRDALPRWGRGLLIVDRFSWDVVESVLNKLLMHTTRAHWAEVAAELNKELHWEFDNYSTQ
jgi:hypothetical protein